MTKRILFILLLAAALLMPSLPSIQATARNNKKAAQTFEKFVDPLTVPPRIVVPANQNEITITMDQIRSHFHRDLPATTEWGYNGASPGPTIEVERGQKLTVHWKNNLPIKHVLPAPANAHGTGTLPDVRAVVHLHGAAVSQPETLDKTRDNDGWPDAWITPGQEQIAEYPNDQEARTLWYHDHAMGTTGRNVLAGLTGFYLIHDEYEKSLNLPTGEYDIPILIQARGLEGDASLYYVKDVTQEFYGNAILTNGKLWPYKDVEPRKYRFRIVNASNARSLALKFNDPNDFSLPGPALNQIGSDGGFLEHTVVFDSQSETDQVLLDPAERADIIVDFSKFAGRKLLLRNYAKPDDGDGQILIPDVMEFKVADHVTQADTSQLPMRMRAIPKLLPENAAATRKITLNTMNMPDGTQMMMLNDKAWSDPITEKPKLGTTEVWEIVNLMKITHPFHIHLVQFQVLDRRPFNVAEYKKSGTVVYTGDAEPPDANEMGWKDTVRSTGSQVTRVIMKFEPFPGYYVYHCHILEHEDMDMMRPFQVVP